MNMSIKYLSPSSIDLFYANQKEFYLHYLSPERPPNPPQTSAMAAGSAFDAYVKSYLHSALFGKDNDIRFNLDALLQAQVESQHVDQGRIVGQYLFDQYKKSGALVDLLTDLQGAIGRPRFELSVMGVINGYREGVTRNIGGVTLLGKPDCIYINKEGYHIILDWKVNGFYSTYKTSPAKGYIRLRDPSKGFKDMNHHPDCFPMNHRGMMINIAYGLDAVNKQWANQLAIYGWLSGVNVGEDFAVCIDQLVCDNTNPNLEADLKPSIRIAEHRLRISEAYQFKIFAECEYVWDIVNSDWFFRNMSKEDSMNQCKLLDQVARNLKEGRESNDPKDIWLNSIRNK